MALLAVFVQARSVEGYRFHEDRHRRWRATDGTLRLKAARVRLHVVVLYSAQTPQLSMILAGATYQLAVPYTTLFLCIDA